LSAVLCLLPKWIPVIRAIYRRRRRTRLHSPGRLREEHFFHKIPERLKVGLLDINSFFVILVDEEGNKFHVPNNFFFQKYVKHSEKRETV